ncbi:MAG: hypothetical protein GY851_02870 [bacterium]|nr:hypothetical protein [bacterium]
MFNPALDRPGEEWCYAAQSTTVIGMPFVPEPVQVTYDGAIYTRYAELAFFYGESSTPVMARNKTFKDGWIPVVEYAWNDEGVAYDLEIFSAELPELGRSNLLQFVRFTMTNPGEASIQGVIAAVTRGSAGRFRLGAVRESNTPDTRYAMEGGAVTRDGKLVYTFPADADRYAVPKKPYQSAYEGRAYRVTDKTATGMAVYRRRLEPGESFSAVFKMPRVPLDDAGSVAAVQTADYEDALQHTIAYWQNLFGDFAFSIPEQRVNDSYRAAMVHLMLASRTQDGQRRQGSGLPYDALFLNDYIDMLLAYDTAGLHQFAEPNVGWLMRKQHPSGMFIDVHNRGDDKIVTSHGQGLFALAYHAVMTQDRTYAEKVYPAVKKATDFIIKDHQSDKRGLIRPSIPYDAPMLEGYHTCHNLFALLALRTSIRVADMLGRADDVKAWTQAEETYAAAVERAIDWTYEKEGYIRSGLYDWKAGTVQNNGKTPNEYPNQDWENNLLVYPTELLAPDDERVSTTLATIRARKYREGVMTYRNGMHIHQYVTLNQANQYRAIGDQKHALLDLYHVLLHNGSTHEGFENLVIPWSNRTPSASCPPPHAWAAAKTALFIRNMLVCEYGGRAGVNEAQRDLYLFSLISPSWMAPGNQVIVRNAPTEMGRVSSTLTFTEEGANMTVKTDFHHAPRHIAFRIPFGVSLDTFASDGKRSFEEGGVLFFSPDTTTVSMRWTEQADAHADTYQDILKSYRSEYDFIVKDDNYDPSRAGKPFLLEDETDYPAEPLSFQLVRKAFSKEYKRRFEEFVAQGGKPYPVEPPSLK